MELLDILQAFKGGKDVEYRALKGQVWYVSTFSGKMMWE